MHRWFAVVMLLGVLFSAGISLALEPGQSQLAGTTWVLYTNSTYNDTSRSSYLLVPRGYLTYYYQFSPKIVSRFTLDIYSDSTASQGAGLKLKYAYFDILTPVKDLNLQLGIIKTYFGTIYDWDYPTIEKAFEDKEKVMPSADFGAALVGYVPGGYGEYEVGIYNGEGYGKTGSNTKVDKYPLFTVNARVFPYYGITLGGSVRYGKEEDTLRKVTPVDSTHNDTTWAYKDMNRMEAAGVARFSYKFFDIWGEYLMTKSENYFSNDSTAKKNSAGFMIMPTVKIPVDPLKNLQVVFRYDNWDPNTDGDSLSADQTWNRMILGLNYFLTRDINGAPTTQIQLNYASKSYENKDLTEDEAGYKKPEAEIGLQFRWDFKSNPF